MKAPAWSTRRVEEEDATLPAPTRYRQSTRVALRRFAGVQTPGL